MRWAAVEALAKIGDKRTVEPLIERLQDEDATVANEHFTKPIDLNQLLTTINRYLGG